MSYDFSVTTDHGKRGPGSLETTHRLMMNDFLSSSNSERISVRDARSPYSLLINRVKETEAFSCHLVII
jgi:hypothetical protein